MITNLNLTCASLFGYNKSEIVNRKITMLMSTLCSSNHDNFILNYLNSSESVDVKKNINYYGKTRSNFIFPINIKLKVFY